MKLFLTNMPETTTKQVASGWQTLNQHWIIKTANIIVAICVILSLVFLILYWRQLPPNVPLWYSQPWGTDELAPKLWLLVLPASSIIWYTVDLLLSVYISMEYRVFSQMLFLTSAAVSFLSFLTLIHIIVLVT